MAVEKRAEFPLTGGLRQEAADRAEGPALSESRRPLPGESAGAPAARLPAAAEASGDSAAPRPTERSRENSSLGGRFVSSSFFWGGSSV